MNYRYLPAAALRTGRLTWLQVLIASALVVACGQAARAEMQGLREVDVQSDPIAPPPVDPKDTSKLLPGTGLCGSFRTVGNTGYFPGRDPLTYPGSVTNGSDQFAPAVNRFMDGATTSTTMPDGQIAYQTLRKPFDLAAQKISFGANVDGDFIATAACAPNSAGCPFPGSGPNNDILPPFASRFRGFFLVNPDLVGQKIHFGFTTNSSVAMRVWAKLPPAAGMPLDHYELISRGPVLGVADFRVTNQIQFKKAGLYAIEILHVSASNAGRLEMAVTTQNFSDIDEVSLMGSAALGPARGNFVLTTPEQFFQRLDGALPFPGQPDSCQQCPRNLAGSPSQPLAPANGCPTCMACNEAAVCQTCNSPEHCGCDTCGPCPTGLPYCAGNPADQRSLHCVQCETDAQCPNGQNCINNQCIGFCPCCDSPLFCTTTDPENQPAAKNCSECRTDSDCKDNGVCDRINARCVPKLPDHRFDTDCGLNAVNCITTTKDERSPRPHCLNAEVCVQCRYDVDCGRGSYCRGGDCLPCTDDRHCGPSCRSCGVNYAFDGTGAMTGSTMTHAPVCYAPAAPNEKDPAPTPTCVECLTDAHCGAGGECDRANHTCKTRPTCTMTCPEGQLCSGGSCVECITSSQCKCGQCTAGVCTPSCGDSTDCRSNQCCTKETGTCTNGRCKPGLTAHGGALCCDTTAGAVGGGEDPATPVRSRAALWTLLGGLVLLGALRLRTLRARALAVGPRGPGSRE